MISLPHVAGSKAFPLPLNDDSASDAAAILLAESSGEQAALWARLLTADPVLLLWVVRQHAAAGEASPPAVQALAQWLAPKALGLFAWPMPEAQAWQSPGVGVSWREVVQVSLQHGFDALGPDPAPAESSSDFTAAALGALCAMLQRANYPLTDETLPAWLIAKTDRFRRDAGVLEASLDQAASPAVSRSLRRWRSKSTRGGEILPPLAHRLRRLRDLETDFEQTLRREKLSAMRELAYGASHEINNPLANISTRAQSLLQEEHEPERRRKLATIHLQAIRAHEMIANLMHFAKPPKLAAEPVDLGECLATVVDELSPWAKEQGTAVHYQLPTEPCVAEVDRQQIMIAARAVLRNALEALAAGGQVEVEVGTAPASPSAADLFPHAVICVRDNGPGIAAEVMPHIFDPFYSGREAGRGLGFGLAWCWRIIDRHGGRIEVESKPGAGTEVSIVLPVKRAV